MHLCQLFVQRMEGQIWATNNPDGAPGATFFFCLPLGLEPTLPTPLQHPSSCHVPIQTTTSRSATAASAALSRKSPRPVKPKLGSHKRHWGMRFGTSISFHWHDTVLQVFVDCLPTLTFSFLHLFLHSVSYLVLQIVAAAVGTPQLARAKANPPKATHPVRVLHLL